MSSAAFLCSGEKNGGAELNWQKKQTFVAGLYFLLFYVFLSKKLFISYIVHYITGFWICQYFFGNKSLIWFTGLLFGVSAYTYVSEKFHMKFLYDLGEIDMETLLKKR